MRGLTGISRRARRGTAAVYLAALAAPAAVVSATDKTYVGPTNGNWSNGPSWSPGATAPAPGDNALILPGASNVTVIFDANYTPVAPLNGLVVSGSGTGVATLLQSANSLAAGTATIGNTGLGVYTISGGTAALGTALPGPNTLALGATATGNGTFNVSNTASVSIVGGAYVGLLGKGLLSQTGGTIALTSGTAQAGNLFVGFGAGSSGTATLGAGATLTATGNVVLGGSLGAAGGVGTFNVAAGASLTASGNLKVWNTAAGGVTSRFSLAGGSVTAAALDLSGDPTRLNWTAGSLALTNSGLTVDAAVTGSNALFGAALPIDPSRSLTISGSAVVGLGSTGSLAVTGGNALLNATGTNGVFIGQNAGSSGTVSVSAGQFLASGTEYVGYAGRGVHTQSGGTALSIALIVGAQPGGVGMVQISGGSFGVINNETIGRAGTGAVTQTGGGHFVAGTLFINGTSAGSATYNLAGGALNTTAIVNNNQYTQTGGLATLGPLSGTGTVSLGGGTGAAQATVSSFAQRSLTIASNGTLAVTPAITYASHATNSVSGALTIAPTGSLDLANHDLLVTTANTSEATVRQYLANGYNGGTWDGAGGVRSSVAAADANGLHALGYSSDPNNGAPAGQVLVRYTLAGDATLDGVVDIADFGKLSFNFGKSGVSWDGGDFTYDGVVDIADFGKLSVNFGKNINTSPASSGGSAGGSAGGGASGGASGSARAASSKAASAASAATASAATLTSGGSAAASASGTGASLSVNAATGDVQITFNGIAPRGYEVDSASGQLNTFDQYDTPTAGPLMALADGTTPPNDATRKHNSYWVVISHDGDPAQLAEGFNPSYSPQSPIPVTGTLDLGNIYKHLGAAGDLTFRYVDASGANFSNPVTYSGVPEPTGLALAGLGAAGLLARRRRAVVQG